MLDMSQLSKRQRNQAGIRQIQWLYINVPSARLYIFHTIADTLPIEHITSTCISFYHHSQVLVRVQANLKALLSLSVYRIPAPSKGSPMEAPTLLRGSPFDTS